LRIGVAAFQLRCIGNDFLFDELPYRGKDLGLKFGQTERLGEFSHDLSFPIVLAFVKRAMSAVVSPRHSVRTSAVSCPRAGAGAQEGGVPSNTVGRPGAR